MRKGMGWRKPVLVLELEQRGSGLGEERKVEKEGRRGGLIC